MKGKAPNLPRRLRTESIVIGRGIDLTGIRFILEERTAGTPDPSLGVLLFGAWSGTPFLEQLQVGTWSQGAPPTTDLDEAVWSDV